MEKWSQTETIGTWIIIALLVVCLFALLVIKLFFINYRRHIQSQLIQKQLQFEYQKRMLELSIDIQERERDRIAADIHDSLIGKLTTLRLTNHLNPESTDLDKSLHDCISEARRISHDLTPPMIQYVEIDQLVEGILSSWKAHLVFQYHKNTSPISLRSDFKLQMVRILQELIVNIHKHAKCNLIKINLRVSSGLVSLVVSDDGIGFDTDQHSKGIGLSNIELRVNYLDGMYKVKSGSGGTTFIFLFKI